MRTTSAAKIVKALLFFGFLSFLILGACLSMGPPTMDIVDFGSTPFVISYVIYVIALISLTQSLGSFSALVKLTTPRTPSSGIYAFVIVWYGVIGIVWAGVGWSGVELMKTLTAKDDTVLDGALTSFHHHSGRSKCNRTAVFATEFGELEVCMGNSGSLLPKAVQLGAHVHLVGRKSSYVFVLQKVMIANQIITGTSASRQKLTLRYVRNR